MKKMKKWAALGLAATMILSLVGCGNESESGKGVKADNGGTPVEISYWNSGLGTDFLDAMIEAFNKKQSDWFVFYNATADSSASKSAFGMSDVDTIDLYMTTKMYDTKDMEPLDDVLDSVVGGETKKIGEKFNSSYLEYEKARDGHYYTLTWGGGSVGLIYNKALFEKAGITQIPRTTNELAVACDLLLSANITPLTHFRGDVGMTGYWSYLQAQWFAQYDGWDGFMNTFYKKAGTANDGDTPTKEYFTTKDGRYQVLKAMETFITPEYVQNGANAQDHITAQTLFLNQDIGMMVGGTWVANEMKGTGSMEDYGVMKTPIVSGIVDKLSSVKSDVELRNLVSAIDTVIDGEAELSEYQSGEGYQVNGKDVSKADWDYVMEARSMVATNYEQHSCIIPNYSDAKDGAKEFLKFFYSDEGYKIFTDTLHLMLPITMSEGEVSIEGWNSFETDMGKMFRDAKYSINEAPIAKHRIFVDGGAHAYAFYNFVEYFCSNNPNDRVTADEAWAAITSTMNGEYSEWLQNLK